MQMKMIEFHATRSDWFGVISDRPSSIWWLIAWRGYDAVRLKVGKMRATTEDQGAGA